MLETGTISKTLWQLFTEWFFNMPDCFDYVDLSTCSVADGRYLFDDNQSLHWAFGEAAAS